MKITPWSILLAFSMLASTNAYAQKSRWYAIDDGPEYRTYVDTASMVRESPTLVKLWVKSEYARPHANTSGKKVKRWMSHYQVDCKKRQLREGEGAEYDARGEVIDSYEHASAAFEDPMPETIAEAIVVAVCDEIIRATP